MEANNTQDLGNAIKQALGIDPNVVPAKTPKSKKEVQTPLQKAEESVSVYFDDRQVAIIVEFVELTIDAEASDDTFRRKMTLLLQSAFPSGRVTWNQWKTLGACLREFSTYAYNVARMAIRLMPGMGAVYVDGTCEKLGELPAKDGGKKSGTRTFSASRWQSGFTKDCKTLRARLKAVPKSEVEPATFAAILAAMKSIDTIERTIRRNVA